TSLLNFQSVIICLGIQFSYHEVSWQENLIMQEYLDQGGNIYMESRVHWRMEDNYGIFDRFNIDTEAYPGLYEIVDGVDSTFTEGLSYMNIATQPFCYFNLKPVPPAYSIYTGRTYPYCAAVAYDAGSYKTIGTIFELGSLIPSDTCLVETYMQEVLDFFGIVESSLGIEEAKPEADRGELLCFPNPFSGTTQIPLLLEKDAYVKGSVYDLQGRLVKEILPARNMQKGSHNLSWDGKNSAGKDMPAGIYIFSVQVDSRVMSGKMVLIP
ncbi:MAG TPA: FlgD immunoglobulin-like domain containing protein, partial [Bacteroidales bacterium]|nr:FlgD immunoglobulin-like domain containing protein [Bacteroidales bacterium]